MDGLGKVDDCRAGRVLILPGCGHPPDRTLLHFADRCARDAGWQTRVVRWGQDNPCPGHVLDSAVQAAGPWARQLAAAGQLFVIAKSAGTYAIPWAAEHGVPGVWLTPILDDEAVAWALADLPATSLLVGGTADPLWDVAGAASSGLPVLQVEDADHNLQVAGNVARSLAVLATVTSAIAEALAQVTARSL